ncbi:unnamed protein product [Litomosoides sigmodontis]|uniref:MH2 domain-containing protein n=1 Tax=Litomosoides sigmodontis TaxID=42156 RepID=A0A3P6SN30_LITSI|nr:unnamed protein product [Litomosoides sigmodontis]
MKIDDVGNVWLKCTEGSVFVTGILGELIVESDPIKIFDLRILKEFVSRHSDFDHAARDRYSRMAITYVHVDKPADPLSSALWFAVIHLTALEMIQILLPSSNSASNAPSPLASTELHSVNHCDGRSQSNSADTNCNVRTISSISSGSSSHCSGVSSAYGNRQLRSRGGAYKKINREPNVYLSSMNTAHSEQQRKEKGRSLLNLSDLDRLRNPVYFRNERENRGVPGHKRLNFFTHHVSASPLTHYYPPNIGWRSQSEASLYCERL